MNKRTLDSVMRRIGRGEMTRAAAAKRLGVSVRHVNRLMLRADVRRPPSERAAERRHMRAEAQAWRELKRGAALAVIAGQENLEQAARRVRLTVRSMYRWVAKTRKIARKSAIFRKK